MYGSIIGDIAGSYLEVLEIVEKKKKSRRTYEERIKIMDKKIPLFDNNCFVTDDSILTVAIADAILNDREYEETLREYGKREIDKGFDKYGRNRFGGSFIKWIKNEKKGDSFGNGAAMRIGPIGYLFNDEETVLKEAMKATIPSHNHIESIKGAQEVSVSIFLARKGYTKEEIKNYLIEKFNININLDLEELRHNYEFDATIVNTVPQALFCFFESNDFEDSIRKALSIGGDTDTLACIVGGISEAYYGVPEYLIEQVKLFIPEYFKPILKQLYQIQKLTYEKRH